MAGQHRAESGSTSSSLPGSGGRHRAPHRHSGAYVWLGTGALTLGVGIALTGGSGIAQADTGSTVNGPANPGGKTIRTVLSANTVTSSSSVDETGAQSKSVVSVKNSVVSGVKPANPGSNDNNNSNDSSLTSQLLGLDSSDSSGLGIGLPGLGSTPSVPFFEFGGGGGLASKIAHALSGGLL